MEHEYRMDEEPQEIPSLEENDDNAGEADDDEEEDDEYDREQADAFDRDCRNIESNHPYYTDFRYIFPIRDSDAMKLGRSLIGNTILQT